MAMPFSVLRLFGGGGNVCSSITGTFCRFSAEAELVCISELVTTEKGSINV